MAFVDDMCLPSVETLELYSFTAAVGGWPSFELGNPSAHQQGAQGVCREISRMISVGALPSLKQVKLPKTILKNLMSGFQGVVERLVINMSVCSSQDFNWVLLPKRVLFCCKEVKRCHLMRKWDKLLKVKQKNSSLKHLILCTSQVGLYPGLDVAGDDLVGPGPRLEDAPHVNSFFLPEPDGWQDGDFTWIRPSHLNAELQRRYSPECGVWSEMTLLNCALITFWRFCGHL